MRKKPVGKEKKRRLSWRKRGLCAVFAGVAVLTAGCGTTAAQQPANPSPEPSTSAPASQHAYTPPPEPGIIDVFNNTGRLTAESSDPYESNWTMMLQYQSAWSKMPKYEGSYQSFLDQFNRFRGETLNGMATNVNALVEKKISYNDTLYGAADTYWATPLETILNRAGDCKDQAILQYFILLNLGVPDSRMFIMQVNAEGKTTGLDHAVLLLNIAPAGALPKFVMLQDSTPVVPANNTVIEKKWNIELANGKKVPEDLVFYDARNQSGFYETSLTPGEYGPAQTRNPAVRPSHKPQIARINPPAFRRFGRA